MTGVTVLSFLQCFNTVDSKGIQGFCSEPILKLFQRRRLEWHVMLLRYLLTRYAKHKLSVCMCLYLCVTIVMASSSNVYKPQSHFA